MRTEVSLQSIFSVLALFCLYFGCISSLFWLYFVLYFVSILAVCRCVCDTTYRGDPHHKTVPITGISASTTFMRWERCVIQPNNFSVIDHSEMSSCDISNRQQTATRINSSGRHNMIQRVKTTDLYLKTDSKSVIFSDGSYYVRGSCYVYHWNSSSCYGGLNSFTLRQ